jgi:hypothetical protein
MWDNCKAHGKAGQAVEGLSQYGARKKRFASRLI